MRDARPLACLLTLVVWTAACAHGRPPKPLPGAPAEFVVVTWNVHGEAGDLPRLIADLRGGRLTGAPARDFALLLQEAPVDVVARARREGLFAYMEPIYPTRGNAILATGRLHHARTVELPRARQRRVAIVAGLDVAGVRVQLATTHLENRVSWWRAGFFSEGARKRQAEALVAALPPGEPTILGGDFNAWLGRREPAWRALAERFPNGLPGWPQPTFRQRLFLDELFFDVPDGWQLERQVPADRYGSDHHPVVGSITRLR